MLSVQTAALRDLIEWEEMSITVVSAAKQVNEYTGIEINLQRFYLG